MTGNEVYRRALQLLNYTDSDGHPSAQLNNDLNKRALTLVNMALADVLHVSGGPVTELETLEDTLPISEEAVPVLVYGVAMLVAQSSSDGDNQQMMAELYNRARCRLPNRTRTVRDVLPYPVG